MINIVSFENNLIEQHHLQYSLPAHLLQKNSISILQIIMPSLSIFPYILISIKQQEVEAETHFNQRINTQCYLLIVVVNLLWIMLLLLVQLMCQVITNWCLRNCTQFYGIHSPVLWDWLLTHYKSVKLWYILC